MLMVLLLMAGAVQATAGVQPNTLSPYAEAVSKIIKFDRRVLIMMKQESGGAIHRMVGYDEDNFQIIVDGVYVPVAEDKTDTVLAALRRKLIPMGYLPFVIEMNGSIKTDKIGVLKGTDQYEILRIMHTDGSHYDILNEDVIERLKDWEKTAPFTILGADNDWVEIEFKTLPRDLKAFAEEVYDFCPDAVDQGPGSPAELAREIRLTRKLFLWWD
jgi:hypothetical protein